MLLAEALAERKDILKQIADLAERATSSAMRYEDEDQGPKDEASTLLVELSARLDRLQQLNVLINRSNNETQLSFEGRQMSMMEAIALRDRLALEASKKRAVLEAVSEERPGRHRMYGYERRSKDDVKLLPALDVAALRDECNSLSGRARALDLEMQKVNWVEQLVD